MKKKAIESKGATWVTRPPTTDETRALLERATLLRETADFDLLVFFARHPRSLLSTESLARLLGYELKDIARSLDSFLDAGLLKRTQTSAHAARLYVFAPDGPHDWLDPVLRVASTRSGRLALREALASRARDAGSRSVLLRMRSGAHGEHTSDTKTG